MTDLTQYQICDLLNRPGPLWLAGISLPNALLVDVNLAGANLYQANLPGANLSHAKLHGANLKQAVLRGANLTGIRFCCRSVRNADVLPARDHCALRGWRPCGLW